jgi:gliding motility-associated-like protein
LFFFFLLLASSLLTPRDTGNALLICDLEVDAGPDTSICSPGGELTLMGSVNGNYLFSEWSPSTGLSDPYILTPLADITGTITYVLTVVGFDPDNPNLVFNGDFESGNVGFTSDYTYLPDLPEPQEMDEGEYGVLADPNNVHFAWEHCNDHTTGSGNMMVLNAAPDYQNVWCQTINVDPNAWYNVAAWVASVHPSSPAILQFSINGIPIGPIVNAPSSTCVWVPFNAVWSSGSSTTATLCILNQNTTVFGNDFAIDDISMVELCMAEDEVTITVIEDDAPEPVIAGPVSVCPGEVATYTATIPPGVEIIAYEWIIPPGASVVNGQGTTEITIIWDEPQDESICLVVETACDDNEGCINVEVNDVPEEPEIAGIASLCPGESAFFSIPENPDEEYQWTVSPGLNIIGGETTGEVEVEWAAAGDAQVCVEVTNTCGSTSGCITVSLHPSEITFFDTVLCETQTIVINGTVYGNGLWSGVEDLLTVWGCDSTVYVEIIPADAIESMVTEYLCQGDSVFAGGMYQFSNGVFQDMYTSSTGCDSIVTTEVIMSPADSNFVFTTTCIAADAGIFISTYSNGSCDSIVIHEVTLVASDTTQIILYSCSPADTGQVSQLLTNVGGCDSFVVIETRLLHRDTTLIEANTCDLSETGISIDTFTNSAGCDSIVIVNIFFEESDTTLLYIPVCMLQDTGTTSMLFTNTEGCDSLVIAESYYAGSDSLFIVENSCSANDTGTTILHLTNQHGCDSVVVRQTMLLNSDTVYIDLISCNEGDTGVVIQMLSNVNGCDSLIITTTALDTEENCVFDASVSVMQPLCFGDTANVVIDVETGLAPFQLFWESEGDSGSLTFLSGPQFKFPLWMDGAVNLLIISANGLSILDTIILFQPEPFIVDAAPVTDYNGFQVQCFGDSNAVVDLSILSPGTPPHQFSWSNGSLLQNISGIAAGEYLITVTDANGCIAIDSVMINEPPPMQYQIEVVDPVCQEVNGAVELIPLSGGVDPWSISVDGGGFSQDFIHDMLEPGMHTLVIADQNDCKVSEAFEIINSSSWTLTISGDTAWTFGSSNVITAQIIGTPQGSISASWSDGLCENCLQREFIATTSATYVLTVTDENGCTATAEFSFIVLIDDALYIPNVFSPNGDGVNDMFYIIAGDGVELIEELSIYDRWGNHIFRRTEFAPNEPLLGWDGTMREKPFNPGVFAYAARVRYQNGNTGLFKGDITLVR